MQIDSWEGCYPSNWKGLIVPEAMSHPAKYSSRLIKKIYEHLFQEGWVKPGDKVIDPFGGVALGAKDAMQMGLIWFGNELELKFHRLGQGMDCPGFDKKYWRRYHGRGRKWNELNVCPECARVLDDPGGPTSFFGEYQRLIPIRRPHRFNGNIELWKQKCSTGDAILFHGDSRRLLEVIGGDHVTAVSSPPYADSDQNYKAGWERFHEGHEPLWRNDIQREAEYGATPGQLGAMKATGFDSAVSSPPYGEEMSPHRAGNADQVVPSIGRGGAIQPRVYGETDGQLGAMKADNFAAAISSPPFLQSEGGTPEPKPGGAIDAALYARHAAGNKSANGYGETEGQLSSMKDGGFEVAVSSPPFNANQANAKHGETKGFHSYDENESINRMKRDYILGEDPANLGNMDMDGFSAAMKSPPFDKTQAFHDKDFSDQWGPKQSRTVEPSGYGSTDGQLGNMTTGNFEAAISSPPYAQARIGQESGQEQCGHGDQYGGTDGQLGSMAAEGFDAAVSSPPWEQTGVPDHEGQTDALKGGKLIGGGDGFLHKDYGETDGQLGNDSGDDFWLAARAIVEQVYQALTPGGHACWIVKDYVKAKKIVPFCDQWRQLCEAVGFVTLHEHHAMLVHSKGSQHTLEGGLVEKKTESKSFFRRLAEKKGSPRIDWETVLCMEKPL